jgi:hypothetical protein
MSTMLELFPELMHATNINFAEVSKKSLRRFGRNNYAPEPLEKHMWAHTFLSDRIREHIREVADLSLRVVPALSTKFCALDERHRPRQVMGVRRQQAVLASSGAKSWPECRLSLMRNLVAGEATVKYVPATISRTLSRTRRPATVTPETAPRTTEGSSLYSPSSLYTQTRTNGSKHHNLDEIEILIKKPSFDESNSMAFSSFHSATESPDDETYHLD